MGWLQTSDQGGRWGGICLPSQVLINVSAATRPRGVSRWALPPEEVHEHLSRRARLREVREEALASALEAVAARSAPEESGGADVASVPGGRVSGEVPTHPTAGRFASPWRPPPPSTSAPPRGSR